MSAVEVRASLDEPDPAQVFSLNLLGVHLLAITCVRTEEVKVYECIVMGLGLSVVIT